MFGTIRKHSTALWIILIAIIIVSFVVFFTPEVGRQSSSGNNSVGTINGREIPRAEYEQTYRETMLRYLFAFGQFPASETEAQQRGVNLHNETVQRLVVKEKLRELGVAAGDQAVAAYIAQSRAFRDPQDGGFRKEAYDNFIARTLPQARPPLSEVDFLRYARTELGIQQLQDVFGLSGGLLTAAEAEEVYRRENEQFLAEIVVFNPADYADKVTVASTNLSQFYSNRLSAYRLPERVVVEFVKFDFSNHLAEAEAELAKQTNLAARIDAIYAQSGTNAFMGTNNLPLSPEAAKAKIRDEMRDGFAQLAARKAANAFATELYDREPRQSENLAALAKAKGLALGESQPFGRFDSPAGLEVMENFAQQAFAIDAEEPFRGPLPGANAYFVIAVKRRLPSEVPPLESVLQRVMDDYRAEEAVRLAREAGTAFAAQARGALAQGRTFAQAAMDAKLTAKTLPPFSNSSQFIEGLDRAISPFDLQNKVRDLKPGAVSDYTGTQQAGFIVHLKGIQAAPDDVVKKELPAFTEQFRELRRRQAFQEWLRRNLETARVTGSLAPTTGN
jgi:hypothetical protein